MPHRLADIDADAMTATCQVCGPVRIKLKANGPGRPPSWRCCRGLLKWKARNSAWRLTPEEREAMAERQGHCCAICREAGRRLVVDHDHETGAVRGLLCVPCNSALGRYESGRWDELFDQYLGRVPSGGGRSAFEPR